MLRQLSCVVILTAASATGIAANASTTRPNFSGASAPLYRANHRGSLWSNAGRADAAAGGAFALAAGARTCVASADVRRGAQWHDSDRHLSQEAPDLRAEYEGLLTDALLRLIKDLRPQLARR